ncbi:MAG: FxsA family protein [Rhodothermia bacterium]|nr:FxsA family protein [Rhodothermia bacterium]
MFRLAFLFLVIPLVELALLIQVGEVVGLGPTILLVVVTGAAGGMLARQQGLSTWSKFNSRLAGGKLPGRELVDGVIILLAGALLITPGLLTDIVGLCGLIPLTRKPVQRFIMSRVRTSFGPAGAMGFDRHGSTEMGRESGTSDTQWGGNPRTRPQHADSDNEDSNR